MPKTNESSEQFHAAVKAGMEAMQESPGPRDHENTLLIGLVAALQAMQSKTQEIEEARERAEKAFLRLVRRLADYWMTDVPAAYSTASRLDGFTHSLLAEFDGCGDGTYELIAWDETSGLRLDIAGGLHEEMKRHDGG